MPEHSTTKIVGQTATVTLKHYDNTIRAGAKRRDICTNVYGKSGHCNSDPTLHSTAAISASIYMYMNIEYRQRRALSQTCEKCLLASFYLSVYLSLRPHGITQHRLEGLKNKNYI